MDPRQPTHLQDDSYPYWLYQPQQGRNIAALIGAFQGSEELPAPISLVPLVLPALIIPGQKVPEGQTVAAVSLAWFDILELMRRDPDAIYQIPWRKWEEIIAGAYERAGFEVVLTPPSHDRGRDIIASRDDVGSIRFYDQVKAYTPGHVVRLEEVHAMVGVLTTQPNVSKAVITTTSTFAPGVVTDPGIKQLIPYRLDLKDRDALLPWLSSLAVK